MLGPLPFGVSEKGSLPAGPVHPRLPAGWGPESPTPLLIVFIFTTPCFSSQVPPTTAFLCRRRSYTISPTVQRRFLPYLEFGVDVKGFSIKFEGTFQGQFFDSSLPPCPGLYEREG